MRIRHVVAAAAAVTGLVLVPASPALAVGETVGSCIAEELAHLEEEGISIVALEEEKDENKEAKEELEAIEEDLEDCLEAPNPIIPEVNEIIWGGLAFVILLGLMWRFGFPAVRRAMQARTERIRADLDEAERTKTEAAEVKSQYEAELAGARAEASRIIEEARAEADTVRADLQARAESDIAEMRARAAAEIEGARERAMADLQSEVSEIVVGAAERVVQANLDPAVQAQLIENYIDQVGSRS